MEVTSETTISDIKRIYRKKSLIMHPDKNPEDPNANQKFIELTKAYTVTQFLTFRHSLMKKLSRTISSLETQTERVPCTLQLHSLGSF
jgi:hypothetical protein